MPNTEPDQSHYLPVAIAVICRGNNVLISKRADHVHLGGLWEFPGGKIEVGETQIQALHRELKEELGINIAQAEPLITIPCQYPQVNVLLHVWQVNNFSGRASGKEQQKIMWVSRSQLHQINFPAINKHIINALHLPDSYVITQDKDLSIKANKEQFLEQFKIKCKQFYRLIQLRFKSSNFNAHDFQQLIQQLLHIANAAQLKIQINSSHLDLLEKSSFKSELNSASLGIHLTSADFQNYNINHINTLKEKFSSLISASCHNQADIEKANQLNVDFIVLSAVKKTLSHPNAQAMGWDKFKSLTKQAQMPVYALGGLNIGDIEQAKQNGAQGIAGISCFWDNK